MILLLLRLRTLRLLFEAISGKGPVKPLPARCKVVRLGIANKHDGIDPWNDCLLLSQLSPTPIPSMIILDADEVQTLEGNVPVIQFDDSTSVFRLGRLSNDNGKEPVKLMEDRIMYCNALVKSVLNKDSKLPPRR